MITTALLCTLALAQDSPEPDASAPGRDYTLEMSFRTRYLFVPDSVLDIWYFSDEEQAEAGEISPDRPHIRGFGLGLEFVIRGATSNGIFYLDWLPSTMGAGYWDDREGLNDEVFDDGSYMDPDTGLGLLAIGANYAYETHLVRAAETDGIFGLSFLVGGGLGVGVLMGGLDTWTHDDDTGTPAYERYETEPPDGRQRLPRVYPMVDLNAGFRFLIGDRVVVRVEGGLHTLIYTGATLGITF